MRASIRTTDDAYVKGDLTPLSAKIEGYIRKVPVNDFQRVKAGELLVEIEDDDYKAASPRPRPTWRRRRPRSRT